MTDSKHIRIIVGDGGFEPGITSPIGILYLVGLISNAGGGGVVVFYT